MNQSKEIVLFSATLNVRKVVGELKDTGIDAT